MSELISGKEALQDIENSQISYNSGRWFPLVNCEFKLHELLNGRSDTGNSLKFRLKHRTITINNIEVPAPFEPKEGENFFYVSAGCESGYSFRRMHDDTPNYLIALGAWRKEDEIKQVVAALREVFK